MSRQSGGYEVRKLEIEPETPAERLAAAANGYVPLSEAAE